MDRDELRGFFWEKFNTKKMCTHEEGAARRAGARPHKTVFLFYECIAQLCISCDDVEYAFKDSFSCAYRITCVGFSEKTYTTN